MCGEKYEKLSRNQMLVFMFNAWKCSYRVNYFFCLKLEAWNRCCLTLPNIQIYEALAVHKGVKCRSGGLIAKVQCSRNWSSSLNWIFKRAQRCRIYFYYFNIAAFKYWSGQIRKKNEGARLRWTISIISYLKAPLTLFKLIQLWPRY